MSEKNTRPLYRPRMQDEAPADFEPDWVGGRAQLARQLTGYISRLPEGGVIGIHAQWGGGKTWFARRWAAQLQEDGYKTAVLDAFQTDLAVDPFVVITAELSALLDDKKQKALQENAKRTWYALAPAAVRAVAAFGSVAVGLPPGAAGAAEKLADGFADATEAALGRELDAYHAAKGQLAAFRATLSELAGAMDKPLVIMVDELDRCRPDYAVRMLERIKHLFDVPNVVFVLFVERTQLERAIEGVYGAGIDATAYLDKFVHLFLRLPKPRRGTDSFARKFLPGLLEHHGISREQAVSFEDAFLELAIAADLSLRELERGVTLYALTDGKITDSGGLLAWYMVLKLRHPGLFDRLAVSWDVQTHREVAAVFEELRNALPAEQRNLLSAKGLVEAHTALAGSPEAPRYSDAANNLLTAFGGYYRTPADVIRRLCRSIDLEVD